MKLNKKGQRNTIKYIIQNNNKYLNINKTLTQSNSLSFNARKKTTHNSFNKEKKAKINNIYNTNYTNNINKTDLKSIKIYSYLYHNSSYKYPNHYNKNISPNNSNINKNLFENCESIKWIKIKNNLFKHKNNERNKNIKLSKNESLRNSPNKKYTFQNLNSALKNKKNCFYLKKKTSRLYNNIINNKKDLNKKGNTIINFSKNLFYSINSCNSLLKKDINISTTKQKYNEKTIKISNNNIDMKKPLSNIKNNDISHKKDKIFKIGQKKYNIIRTSIKPNINKKKANKNLTNIINLNKKYIFKNENTPLSSGKKKQLKKKEYIKENINSNKLNINNNNYRYTVCTDKNEIYTKKYTGFLEKKKIDIKTIICPKIKEKFLYNISLDSNEKDTQEFESKFINYDLGKSDKISTLNSNLNDNCYKNVNTENLVFEYETPKEEFEKYAYNFINDSNRKNKNSFVKYISCNDKVK